MLHYQLQAEREEEPSPSLSGMHYRSNSDIAFVHQLAQSDQPTSDKELASDEEKEATLRRDDGSNTIASSGSGIYVNTHMSHHTTTYRNHSDRKRDRVAEEREERREEKEKAREDTSASSRRQASPLPPPMSARRPSLPTPPPHMPRTASPLPPASHQPSQHHGAYSPSPPAPPPPPPLPPPSLHLRHMPQPPPRSSQPISLKNKATRERQQTIHRLLSGGGMGGGMGKEPTSVSSPEYEFSDAESSTRSQPRTPSSARNGSRKERETPAELMFAKEAVADTHDTLPPTSTLTSSLQQSQAPTYTRQIRTGLLTSAAIKGQRVKVTVFLPVSDMCMWLEVGAASAAEVICRIVLDVYRKENNGSLDARMLDSVRCYQLFIAEEDGCVDEDFPGLDPSAVIGSTGSTHFALRHVGEPAGVRAGRPRGSPTLSFNPRPSISQSLSLSDERVASANASVGGSAEGSRSAAASVRHGAAVQEQAAGAGMSGFETESGEALVKRPWYSKLLCCAMDDEGWGDANDMTRRRSRGDSVGGVASPNSQRSSIGQTR